MTRYERLEAARLARGGRDTTVAVRVDREPGDGVRLAKAALLEQRPRTGMRAVIDGEFRMAMRRKIGGL